MSPKKVSIFKSLADLKLKEPVEEVYVYMDHNKRTIEPYYNDEIKLPLNIGKLLMKAFPNQTIKPKKIFDYLNDITIHYYPEKQPDNLVITFYTKF